MTHYRMFALAGLGIVLSGACSGTRGDGVGEGARSQATSQPSAPTPPAVPAAAPAAPSARSELRTGEAAKGDWTSDAPGVRRKLTAADLPAPYSTASVKNHAKKIAAPQGANPRVPPGFQVARFATELTGPRMIRTAPNGDVFVAESESNRVRVLRDADGDGKAEVNELFADGLRQPFGIAFYPLGDSPEWVYIANTDSVVRYAYVTGDLKARGTSEKLIASISGGGRLEGGGHWTRDLAFSKDGAKLYVAVGSRSNVSDDAGEARRARIFEYTPDGKNEKVYATGIRNPVGLAVHRESGELWASVNERDELGDHLVPDYVTHVERDGFYGWPWFYIGAHQDPRHEGKRDDLKEKVVVPDVLLQSHSASLGMAFYDGEQFPPEHRGQPFAALHGSWNRSRRTGYKVVYLPTSQGRATGEYVDFMTGFVTPEGDVWGRPVAVAVGKDGALLVSDDAGNVIWRVTYGPTRAPVPSNPQP